AQLFKHQFINFLIPPTGLKNIIAQQVQKGVQRTNENHNLVFNKENLQKTQTESKSTFIFFKS
ncbi:MAG TPA: hypothetical protein PKW49_10730, partial [Paludibacteraceae bacterium]|nr:hypothetical protein [Paludibacteraceae bacterium]HQF50840.1 hypothetical protein [Paludibacteraceae bacterium]